MDRIKDLPGLAKKSEDALALVEIYTVDDLRAIGPCLLYTSPSPRDVEESRMPSSA